MTVRGSRLVALALSAFVVGVGVPSASAAAPRIIVTPTPGATVTGNTVRVVVRGAGNEYGDLSAKLNGRQIGRDFGFRVRGRRVLRLSLSHGLRHGRNVLTVAARRGIRTRRATVRFTVRRTAHLVGAGRDRFVTVGTRAEIASQIRRAPGGRRPGAMRLRITRTPPGSRAAKLATLTPATTTREATLPLTPLRPALVPDLPGTYTVRVTVGRGRTAVSDDVTLDARPKDPLVPVDTFAADAADRPTMRLGGTTYTAPYLSAVGGKGQYANGAPGVGSVSWNAEWHVIAVSRTNLQVLWQRTYGFCRFEGQPARECRAPADGPAERPVIVDSAAEVKALTPGKDGGGGALIIARSVPTASVGSDEQSFLSAIGYERRPRGADVPHNYLHSVIGVPGMDKGEADMSGVRSRGWLRGFLTPDQNDQYHFLRGQRPLFDTRGPDSTCTPLPAQCAITQTVDGKTVTGTVPNGRGGYFVSAWDPETLAPRHAEFVTIDNDSTASQDGTRGLLALLQRFRDDGSIILLSTRHTAGMDPGTLIGGPPDAWNALTDLIASIGGTTNGFLRTASTRGADYTLVGWGGAGEGGGREAAGTARLRGALLTDNHGNFIEPANVSSVGPPAERLNTLMITPTSTDWRYPPGTPEGDAIACIGAKEAQGIDIRAEYQGYSDLLATELQGSIANMKIEALKPVPGTGLTCTPTQKQFDDAKAQLVDELDQVAKVRTYMRELSSPDLASADTVWGQAITLSDELEGVLDEEEQQREVIADSLGLVATLLDLIAPGISTFLSGKKIEKISHAVEASAATFELASRSIERGFAGAENEDIRVAANGLATELQIKAKSTTAAFEQLGDVLVSDPGKLAEVGGNYHCKIGVGGCPEGMEEYSATDSEIKELTNVALRGMGREIYSTLVPRMYQTWDTGLTSFPGDPYDHFFCVGARSPFGTVPSDQYAPSLERVNYGHPSLYRIYLSVRSATYWEAIPEKVAHRMFGDPGPTWNVGGLGMDLLTYLREMDERFTPGSYTCSYGK